MKRANLVAIAVILTLVAALFAVSPTTAQEVPTGPTIDIIVQTQGNTDALVAHIEGLGGTVSFQYENVPAVAASIPSDALSAVAGFRGVTTVEKDGLVTLGIEEDGEKPMAFHLDGETVKVAEDFSVADLDLENAPEGWTNFLLSGAIASWGETNFGEGSVIAVVDTGVMPTVCLDHAVIGAPGYPDGYNATDDGISPTSPYNHYHGTFVSNIAAADCGLLRPEGDTVLTAYQTYLPNFVSYYGKIRGTHYYVLPNVGIAPGAQIYPVKVFDYTGGGTPTSVILNGLDHVLSLKLSGALDVDVINMSLGGGTGFDGRDAYDRFMAELNDAGMLVVTSAGNSGPTPNSVGSPATSYDVLSVGALDYDLSSSILYEWLGLRIGIPGMGEVMRPTTETRAANFSSRGPLSDGRSGPEISALGLWNFAVRSACYSQPGTPLPCGLTLSWGGGTSYSSPTIAGGAALLNAWGEANGIHDNPDALEGALVNSATLTGIGDAWTDYNTVGAGQLDVPGALYAFQTGDTTVSNPPRNDRLTANVLGQPEYGNTEVWESDLITVDAGESYDVLLEVSDATSNVYFEVFDVSTPNNSAYAYWPNALEVHLQTAKRSSVDHLVDGVYWYPYFYGPSFDINVGDGPVNAFGSPWAYQPMEPGLMKLSLIGDYSNEDDVSFRVRVTRENYRVQSGELVANGQIDTGDDFVVPVYVPAGTNSVTFDLRWNRDWTAYPTADLDLIVFAPDFSLASIDGATLNAPERAVIDSPMEGTYYVIISGYEAYKSTNYDFYVTFE